MITTLRVLRQAGKTDKEIIKSINKVRVETSGKRSEGMLELFCDLMHGGKTESYNAARIYELATLLSNNGLVVKVEYRLTNDDTGNSFTQGTKVLLELKNGEIVSGILKTADSLSLRIERRNQSEEYDLDEIESMSKVIELEQKKSAD